MLTNTPGRRIGRLKIPAAQGLRLTVLFWLLFRIPQFDQDAFESSDNFRLLDD